MSLKLSHLPKLLGRREDSFHIHKLLGLTCLIHYSYRFYEWKNNLEMSFTNDYRTLAVIIIHTMLSISSLIFHIPTIRNPVSPMIYPEFRAHSIIFALRSLVVMICHYFSLPPVSRTLTVISTICAADLATKYYIPQGSTMRAMPFPEWISDNYRKIWNYFYSVSQVFATLECLMRYDMSHAFMVLFPIQLAAFLMTCVRKGIITNQGWHIYYTLSLLTTFFYANTCNLSLTPKDLLLYRSFAIAFIIVRFYFKGNKYLLWSLIVIIYHLSFMFRSL